MPACIDWEDYFDEPSDNSNGGALYATIREAYKNKIVDTVLWTHYPVIFYRD